MNQSLTAKPKVDERFEPIVHHTTEDGRTYRPPHNQNQVNISFLVQRIAHEPPVRCETKEETE